MAIQGNLENVVDLAKHLGRKGHHAFYLGHMAQDKKFFDKILKTSGPKNPFYESEKKMQRNMRCIINAMDIAEVRKYN